MEREWLVVVGVVLVAVVLGAASLERCDGCGRVLVPWQAHELGLSGPPGRRWRGTVCSAECAAKRIEERWQTWGGER